MTGQIPPFRLPPSPAPIAAAWVPAAVLDRERMRRVVCAAIRAQDGALLLGIRHYSRDMHEQIGRRMDGRKFMHRLDDDQGFVDQFGVFMSRSEAFKVAARQGQIVRPDACGMGVDGPKLYSEGLY